MKRIAMLVVLILVVTSLGSSQTRYTSNLMSFSDTATTAWQSYLVDTVKTYLAKNYYNLEIMLKSGNDLYIALTVADTALAGTPNRIRKNITISSTSMPISFFAGPTTSTRIWYKSSGTAYFNLNFW
jgi:hypothetical protein